MLWRNLKNLPPVRAGINTLYHLPIAKLACLRFGYPARNLILIGVTGTDGKTTTATLIYHLLCSLGLKAALISTVEVKLGDYSLDTGLHVTSPHPFKLQRLLRFISSQGYKYVVLEATSHGLHQKRFHGLRFAVGVITNITREHLDYHQTESRYLAAKTIISTISDATLLNLDDPKSAALYQALTTLPNQEVYSYSINPNSKQQQATFYATKITLEKNLTKFTFTGRNCPSTPVVLPMTGRYNVENATAALGAVCLINKDITSAVRTLKQFSGISGRLEPIDLGQPFQIFIDFAHTPNSMRRVLSHLRQLLPPDGRLIAIFGCAGLRDQSKRIQMGRLAGRLADISLVTAEDPRTESLTEINHTIAIGLASADACRINLSKKQKNPAVNSAKYFDTIPNRQTAINTAVNLACPHDIVVSLGKGHEKSMCFGTTELPWSEHDAFKKAIYNRYHINA